MVASYALALALFAPWFSTSSATADDALLNRLTGRAFFRDVLRASAYGLLDTERAAFIVKSGDGSPVCLMWPATSLPHEETFRGVMPPNTMAIVHTHPKAWPLPSAGDVELATRLHIPIYVVTTDAIYRTESGQVLRVAARSWYRSVTPAATCSPLGEQQATP